MLRDIKLIVLLIAGSLTVMAGGVIAPVLPELILNLDIDPSIGSSLVSLHFLTVALATPVLGILADRSGQLPILVCSLVAYAGFGMAGGLVQDLLPLMILRGLLGVASGGIAAAGLGLLGKLYIGEARVQAIAYVASALTLANIIYPLLGGWVGSIHWRLVFSLYGISIPLAIWSLSVLRTAHSPLEHAEEASSFLGESQHVRQVLTHPVTLFLLVTLSIASGTVYAVVAYLPLYLKLNFGSDTTLIGTILAVQAIGAVLSSAFGMRLLIKRFGAVGAIAIGLGLMATMLALFPAPERLYGLYVISILFGLGFGLVVPSLYNALADLASENMQSSILAAGTGAGFLGQFLSPILLGIVLRSRDLPDVFYTAAIVDLAAGLLLIAVMKQRAKSPF
ncbi:MAG: MFS transporter [Elainellaceae cyanobacterium]